MERNNGSPISHLHDVYKVVKDYEVISLPSLQLMMRLKGLDKKTTRKATNILLEGGFLYSPTPNVFSILHLED